MENSWKPINYWCCHLSPEVVILPTNVPLLSVSFVGWVYYFDDWCGTIRGKMSETGVQERAGAFGKLWLMGNGQKMIVLNLMSYWWWRGCAAASKIETAPLWNCISLVIMRAGTCLWGCDKYRPWLFTFFCANRMGRLIDLNWEEWRGGEGKAVEQTKFQRDWWFWFTGPRKREWIVLEGW